MYDWILTGHRPIALMAGTLQDKADGVDNYDDAIAQVGVSHRYIGTCARG